MTAALIAAGALPATVFLLLWLLQRRRARELTPWHRLRLRREYRAGERSVHDFDAYLAREEELFAELDLRLLRHAERDEGASLDRYRRNSRSDPGRQPTNWNRTFEIVPGDVRGAALLLHGLTDSPYSLRRLAEVFAGAGLHTIVPRLPGHGTVPAALRTVHRRDWRAAVRLAAEHAAERADGGPVYLAGYSAGATLAVDLLLEDDAGPMADCRRLFLFSPAFGLARTARLASLHRVYSFLPGFEGGRWAEVLPEFDPFKYNSFPKHAASQIERLVREVGRRLDRSRSSALPPITAFQSTADATVVARAVVDRLFAAPAAAGGGELVLFDVNHHSPLRGLFTDRPWRLIDELAAIPTRPYDLTVLTHRDGGERRLTARTHPAGGGAATEEKLEEVWPEGVCSLSHVALVFPPDDPIYGGPEAARVGDGPEIGALAPKGERGLLRVPADLLLRQRFNPFFGFLARKVAERLERDQLADATVRRKASGSTSTASIRT